MMNRAGETKYIYILLRIGPEKSIEEKKHQDGQAIDMTFLNSRSRKKMTSVLMLVACLGCRDHSTLIFGLFRPTVTLHQGQGHRTCMTHRYAMRVYTVMPSLNAIA